MKDSGLRYSSPRRTPQCTHGERPQWPASRVPITAPLATDAPFLSVLRTGSKLLRRPLPWSMVMTGRSTTVPTKLTVPASGAVTGPPSDAEPRSTPRCPLSHGLSGGSNGRRTGGRGASGQRQPAGAGAAARAGEAAGRESDAGAAEGAGIAGGAEAAVVSRSTAAIT